MSIIFKRFVCTNKFISFFGFATNKWQNNNYQKYSNNDQALTSQIQFRNYNIAINTSEADIFFFPFHPTVVKKSATSYQVKKNSTVLAVTFLQKHQNMSEEIRWQNRKTFTLKFIDLSKFLQVEPGKAKQSTILSVKKQNEMTTYQKELQIKDFPQKEIIQISLKNNKRMITEGKIFQSQLDKPFKTNIKYQQYRLIYQLIKNSVFELSGWKFQLQLQRQQYFTKILNPNKLDEDLDNFTVKKVVKDYSKEYKTYKND